MYEVGDEAKLFYITGMKHDLYPKTEVKNFLIFMKLKLISR